MLLQLISSDRADEIERDLEGAALLPGTYNLRRRDDGERWELVQDVEGGGPFTAIGGVDPLRGEIVVLRGNNVRMLLVKTPSASTEQ